MYGIYVKPITQYFNLEYGINIIEFTNPINYRNLIFNFEENIILSKDNDALNHKTNFLAIVDPLRLDLNDKKILTQLYKKMSKGLSEKAKSQLALIEKNIFELFEEISLENSVVLEYNDSIDITKLFSFMQVILQESSNENYLEFLTNYIVLNCELNNYSLVLAFDLSKKLTLNEYSMLSEELKSKQICLIDFALSEETKKIIYISVDDDWTVI